MYDIQKPGRKPPVPKSAMILISVLVLSIIPLIILISSLLPNGSSQRELAEIVPVTREHNPDQEIIVNSEHVTLYVPKEAIDLSGSFVILPRQPNLFSYAGESEWTRPVVVDIQYRNADGVSFPGVTFSQPVSICFILTSEQWTDFTKRPDAYQVQYFDDQQFPNRWVAYPLAIDPEEYQLCTQTDHLSIYALAVKIQDQIPITGPTTFPTVIATASEVTIFPTLEDRPPRDESTVPPVNTRPPNPTKPPTEPPPTEPPPTEPPPTEPPPTEPPPTEPPPTEPPPTEPPPTEEPPPPPTEEPPAPPSEEPPADPPPGPPADRPKGPPDDPPKGPPNDRPKGPPPGPPGKPKK